MEFHFIARFHAGEGCEAEVAAALGVQVPKARAEPGCIAIQAFRSTRNPRLFFIYSQWQDERAFDIHDGLPNTAAFVEKMEPLIDHPFDANRLTAIA